jgi:hypothetical protein
MVKKLKNIDKRHCLVMFLFLCNAQGDHNIDPRCMKQYAITDESLKVSLVDHVDEKLENSTVVLEPQKKTIRFMD